MAFDPNNASLISNVVAGTGVTITHSQVSGVDTFTAQIDQTWLANYITTNVGGSLTLSAADEARIAALEAAVGTGASADSDGSGLVQGQPATTTPVGENGTTSIIAAMSGSTLANDITITYTLKSFDGTLLGAETLFIAAGNFPNSIAWALWANARRNAAMNKSWDLIEVTDDNVVITWKTTHQGSTIVITVDSSNAADAVSFTVTDY